ncbi:MAG TPA: cell division protein FtsZ [Candidatus Limnocylindria bacterium]|nr:cell division protein FtsZ [Candidatus Limnocylindria bacterium]
MPLFENDQVRFALLALAIGLVAGTLYVMRGNRRVPGRVVRVVGVGGGGANAVDAMIRAGLKGVEYVAINTDLRALNRSQARTKVAIGRSTTHGLGAGGSVREAESAAREAAEAIGGAIDGSDLVVIVAGLGGGTGSGAAPVVAELARGKGALTLAVVTMPFGFEGVRKAQVAQDASAALTGLVDAVATVPNDQVRELMPADVTVDAAFAAIDEAMHRSVAEIVELAARPGRVNLDFADVRAVLRGGSAASVGFGSASGETRAADATTKALTAARVTGAGSVLVNVSGSKALRLAELDAVSETILARTGRDTSLVFGVSINPRLRDEVHVTLIATAQAATARTTDTPEAPAIQEPPAEPKRVSAQAIVAEVRETPTAEEPAEDAPGSLDKDAEDWRPVWLRRSAPPNTPAPEASSVQRSQSSKTSRRARRRQTQQQQRTDEGA